MFPFVPLIYLCSCHIIFYLVIKCPSGLSLQSFANLFSGCIVTPSLSPGENLPSWMVYYVLAHYVHNDNGHLLLLKLVTSCSCTVYLKSSVMILCPTCSTTFLLMWKLRMSPIFRLWTRVLILSSVHQVFIFEIASCTMLHVQAQAQSPAQTQKVWYFVHDSITSPSWFFYTWI